MLFYNKNLAAGKGCNLFLSITVGAYFSCSKLTTGREKVHEKAGVIGGKFNRLGEIV